MSVKKSHLSKTPSQDYGNHIGINRPREYYCKDCLRRVTIGPDGTEYGHSAGSSGTSDKCPYRPEEFEQPKWTNPNK